MTDPITEQAIRNELRAVAGERVNGRFNFKILGETGSTSDDAKRAGNHGEPEGTVWIADHQTGGRGRRDNRWESPPGRNLLFSIILRPNDPVDLWTRIPHLIGLAVANGIESALAGTGPIALKWPNDLMLDNRKLGGILVESQLSATNSFCVAGVGLNVNIRPEEFPPDLQKIGVSLYEFSGQILSRSIILAHILAEWQAIYPAGIAVFPEISRDIEQRSFLTGHNIEVTLNDNVIRGKAAGMGPDGELLIDQAGKLVEVRAADRVRRVD